jgi:hypothetical protein
MTLERKISGKQTAVSVRKSRKIVGSGEKCQMIGLSWGLILMQVYSMMTHNNSKQFQIFEKIPWILVKECDKLKKLHRYQMFHLDQVLCCTSSHRPQSTPNL